MTTHRVLVGTSGFSYRDWVGPFYPPGTSHREFLRLYQGAFPLVEINASYYQIPTPETSAALLQKVSGGFRFVFKTHGSLTHTISSDWQEGAKRFLDGIDPIVAAGALSGILVQLPYSFHYDVPNRRHLDTLLEVLGTGIAPAAGSGPSEASMPLPPTLFVEFRNQEWQKERVFAYLEEIGASVVQTDLPDLPGLPGARDLVLSGRGYLRLHGRNTSTWWNGDNRSRYDYLYDGSEIAGLADRVVAMAERSEELIVTFNNHANAQAVKNAYELLDALGDRGLDAPGGTPPPSQNPADGANSAAP